MDISNINKFQFVVLFFPFLVDSSTSDYDKRIHLE